jgi:LDH2 family malate/lactate/ureidoglycolate dehydrogenase
MDRYPPQLLKRWVAQLAAASGVPNDDAAILADSLVEADVHGTSTHGVSRLAIYLKRIQRGLIDPRAALTIERRRGATLAVDAGNGLGQVQAVKTLDLLIPMAREMGVATATIRRSQHFGALAYYCNRAAEAGMILLATSNCEPSMSPEGGREAFFGTNPIAMSCPTGKGFPIKVDLATSLVARGNIIAAQKRGESIPEGWALDAEGRPTTDAEAALAGTVLAMAGHKGYALALMVEVLSGVLAGAAVGPDIGSMYKHLDREQNVGHFFSLMDISAFMEPPEFTRRIDAMIDRIKGCRKRPGVEEILVPGERSSRTAECRRREGVTVDAATLAELKDLSAKLGVALPVNGTSPSSPSPGTPGEASGIGDCPRAGRGAGSVEVLGSNPHPNPPPEYREREIKADCRL